MIFKKSVDKHIKMYIMFPTNVRNDVVSNNNSKDNIGTKKPAIYRWLLCFYKTFIKILKLSSILPLYLIWANNLYDKIGHNSPIIFLKDIWGINSSSGYSSVGRVHGSGPWGRPFKSGYPDQYKYNTGTVRSPRKMQGYPDQKLKQSVY